MKLIWLDQVSLLAPPSYVESRPVAYCFRAGRRSCVRGDMPVLVDYKIMK